MLLRVTTGLTRNIRETEKAYALACFNVLAHNRDDHAKNFSFLLDARDDWVLSPAAGVGSPANGWLVLCGFVAGFPALRPKQHDIIIIRVPAPTGVAVFL